MTGDPYSPETWSVGHLIDQDLLMKWAALIGRKLSSLERTTVKDCLFHKRKMRFEEDTIVLEAPLATVIRRMIYPDKEKNLSDLDWQRPSLLTAQLLNGFSNPEAWERCGSLAYKLLDSLNYDFNSMIACYISKRTRPDGLTIPWLKPWTQLRPICQRLLYGYELPIAWWEREITNRLTLIPRFTQPRDVRSAMPDVEITVETNSWGWRISDLEISQDCQWTSTDQFGDGSEVLAYLPDHLLASYPALLESYKKVMGFVHPKAFADWITERLADVSSWYVTGIKFDKLGPQCPIKSLKISQQSKGSVGYKGVDSVLIPTAAGPIGIPINVFKLRRGALRVLDSGFVDISQLFGLKLIEDDEEHRRCPKLCDHTYESAKFMSTGDSARNAVGVFKGELRDLIGPPPIQKRATILITGSMTLNDVKVKFEDELNQSLKVLPPYVIQLFRIRPVMMSRWYSVMAEERSLSWCPVILALEREDRENLKGHLNQRDDQSIVEGSSPGGSFDMKGPLDDFRQELILSIPSTGRWAAFG